MKRVLSAAALLLLASHPLYSETVVQTADRLIASRAYESAFLALGTATDDALVVAKKTEICLNYFVQSLNHQAFAFRDLAAGDTLDDLRSGQGTYNLHPFDPAEIIGKLLSTGNRDPVLYKALGDYYYDVGLRYRGRWLISDLEVTQRAVENYAAAYAAGLRDVTTLTNYADKAVEVGQFSRAVELYKQALSKDPLLLNADFNLAYASLQVGNLADALSYGEQAIAKYGGDPNYRMDALLLCTDAAYQAEDYGRALGYLKKALEISRADYRVYQKQAYVYLAQGNLADAEQGLDRLFELDPTNPGATQLVTNTLESWGKKERIPVFFARNLPRYNRVPEAQANLAFHQALDFEASGDAARARQAATLSQTKFREAGKYDGDIKNAVEALLARNP